MRHRTWTAGLAGGLEGAGRFAIGGDRMHTAPGACPAGPEEGTL